MTDDDFELSRRKILAGIGAVGAAGVGAGLGTSALFGDEEAFENNSLVAGELDLKVSWDEHYFDGSSGTQYGEYGGDGVGFPAGSDDPVFAVDDGAVGDFMDATRTEQFPEGGLGAEEDPCVALADVPQDLPAPVIELDDVKPGDFGEVTFDFSLCDNPGYLWMTGELAGESQNGIVEPEPTPADGGTGNDDMSLWPLAGLAAVPAIGGDGDSGGESGSERAAAPAESAESVDARADGESGRSALRKGAAAAGAGAAGLAAASGTASADGKPESADPDGDFDVSISNSSLSVSVGELASGTTIDGNNWNFQGQGTLYRESYGFRDGTGSMSNAEEDGTVQDTFPGSVSPGTTATATITIPVTTSGGTDTTLTVDRNVTLDPNEATLRVRYDVENTGGAAIDDLRISQYVDYDIGAPGGEVGEYYLDTATDCEFIFQEDTSLGLFAGFTGEDPSVNHDLDFWNTTLAEWRSGNFNNDDLYPSSGTADVGLAFEWSLGALASGETTSFRNSFVYNENEADFQTELCEESPGTPTPTPEPGPTGGEIADLVQARAWYDADCDNVHDDGEQVFLEGSLREVLAELSSGTGVPLDGDESTATDFDELGGDPTATSRDCYGAAPDVSCVGFEWWVPIDVGNSIQTDAVTFDLGFYTEQCRNNAGGGVAGNEPT